MTTTMLRHALLPLLLVVAGCASLPEPAVPPAPPAAVEVPPLPPAADPLATPATSPPAPAAAASAAPVAARPDPLRTMDGVVYEDPSIRIDLWERVRQGFSMPWLEGERVRHWEQWYSSRPDYVQRMTERGGRYLFHIVEEVDRRRLPTELALLPFIESAFNPQATSRARASGMWQFMPATGRDFELRQNVFRDDRRDVLASTRAALDYLEQLYATFGDWHLALAAYNWGQGNVQRAIARAQKTGRPAGYEDLRMPDETRNYVPKLQAVKNIVLGPDTFGLQLPRLENHPYFLSVPIERDIDVALAAQLAGLPLDEFRALNPQLNKPVILAAGTPQLQLPYDNANRFLRAVQRHDGPLASWTAWVAPATMKPSAAAKAVGMSEEQLRQLNHIPPRMLVKAGSTLLVPRAPHGTRDVTEHVADHAELLLSPERTAKRTKKGKGVRAKGGGKTSVAKSSGRSSAKAVSARRSAKSPSVKPAAAKATSSKRGKKSKAAGSR